MKIQEVLLRAMSGQISWVQAAAIIGVTDRQMRRWRETPEVGRLTVRAVKLFADGALASRGAALFEPYSDDPGNVGLALTDPTELRGRIRVAARAGFQPAAGFSPPF